MASPMRPGKWTASPAGQGGFTYWALLFAILIFGIALGAFVPMLAQTLRQEREAQMIEQAQQIAKAIRAYALMGQGGLHLNPHTLEDLLDDQRFGGTRRYLREIPWDAVSRSYDWGLIHGDDGGIIGVYSQSTQTPLRQTLPASVVTTEDKVAHYRDWHFMASAVQER